MPSKALVVDANILVRAVLGKRAREVIEAHAGDVSFFVPESAFHVAMFSDTLPSSPGVFFERFWAWDCRRVNIGDRVVFARPSLDVSQA